MPAGSELMVQDTIVLSKVAGPANSTFPPYVRFISLGAGILF